VVINGEASGFLEELKYMFSLEHRISRAAEEDQRVVGILQDRARCARDERMNERGRVARVMEETVKHISNDDEKIGIMDHPGGGHFDS
jgi:hypothetical protein